MSRIIKISFVCLTLILGLASCSVYKYVPEGQYLLDKVEVTSQDKKLNDVQSYKDYSYQTPNSRWFGLVRLPLRIYSLSGSKNPDRGINRTLRKMGEAPVVFDELLTEATVSDMKRALRNSGYLNADVEINTVKSRKPKTKVQYNLIPGKMFVLDDIRYTVHDSTIYSIVLDNATESLIYLGMNLDANILDAERNRIVEVVHRYGYYRFNKDFITFVADTTRGSDKVGLRMIIAPESVVDGVEQPHRQYTVSSVNYTITDNTNNQAGSDHDGKPILRQKTIDSHSFLREGMIYNSDSVAKTYSSLSRLGVLRYSNIRFDEVPGTDNQLKADVSLISLPKHSFSFEIEGTNTAGDLGAAASMSFTDRNLFRGSEQLTLKVRGAYESISNLPGYTGDTYLEYGAEANLDFPEFLVPFMSQELQRKSQFKD